MDSLKWLVAEQHRDDPETFVPIGSSGFFIEGKEKARFDQQPVEACAMVAACLEVYRLTEEVHGLKKPNVSFRGSLARTICRFRFTIQPRAGAEMGFTLIA